jgi:polar amino acid transport system ATP-binding protein
MTANTRRLPIIDVAAGETDAQQARTAAEIDAAAAEYGFFYIVGHGVPQRTIDSLIALSDDFFRLDEATKRRIDMSRGGRAWRGYFPVGGELTSGRPDLKEGLYFGQELPPTDPRVRAGLPLHGPNLFPQEVPGLREAVLEYVQALTAVGHRVMALIARGLGLEANDLDERYMSEPTVLFRIFRYPPPPIEQRAEVRGVGEHTDYGLLTLLYQDDCGGLEVHHDSGWLEAPPVPGSFVVNVGDMLERLTSGRYRSALHRVINRCGRPRLSMPFFFDPRFDAVLEPIPNVWPIRVRPGLLERWDGINLREVRGTYGEYLIGKVSKVFPELGRGHLPPRTDEGGTA